MDFRVRPLVEGNESEEVGRRLSETDRNAETKAVGASNSFETRGQG